MLARRLVLGSAAMAALSVLVVLALWVVTSAREPAAPGAPPARAQPPDGLAILDGWDSLRAEAWAAGDVGGLRALYVDGSHTGRRDAAMLRAYVARGLSVRGLRTQVLGVRVLHRDETAVALSVTDRMRGAVAVGGGRRVQLPADRASTRNITLRRVDGAWLVEEVRE
ncbi:hypothetical protein [uncultured Nocardioides sp.]|uniref:hypothetical protein n=1 Tax=uncultured Nocardioides sp. TaxID=198441 RepID=UPI0025F6CFBE|nr:hypothetical protein [uncultured Nocardioides sp.]